MFKRCSSILMIFVLLLGLMGCGTQPQKEQLHIAVAIPPLAAFLEAVVGDVCSVQVMIPSGYSPETYAPTPKELATAQQADVYFSAGVPAEAEAILPHLNPETQVVQLGEVVDHSYPPRMMSEVVDPHRWLSPKRAKVMVAAMLDTLCELDPANTSLYEHNAHLYMSELTALDEELQSTLKDLKNRSFLVYHPAFGYFAEDYGLTMVALQEEGKEATPQQLQEMVDFAKSQELHVIFYQEEIDSRQAEAFARELSGIAVVLNPLSKDYCNNLRQMASAISEAMKP